ncbi:MAG: hypothetical protein AB8G23_03725 [Myxococcota bacterium]
MSAIRGIPFLWGFCEALRYYAQMRRRLTLGLADPVVANRFLPSGMALSAGSLHCDDRANASVLAEA